MVAYRRVYDSCVTCRLTAKNRDQLRSHTVSNRVWATFTFFTLYHHAMDRGHLLPVTVTVRVFYSVLLSVFVLQCIQCML